MARQGPTPPSVRRNRRQRRARRRRLIGAGTALVLVAALAGAAVLVTQTGGSSNAQRRIRTGSTSTSTTTTIPPTTTTTIPPPPAVAPRVDHVVTTDPVVFVTIDDGYHPLPDVLAFLQAHQAPVTAFLIAPIAQRDADFYRQVLQLGGTVENHTVHHIDLSRLSLQQQMAEFCPAADLEGAVFGRRPLLARPPGGAENQFTDHAVGACGMYDTVLWDAKFSDHKLTFAHPGGLRAGDIVLMHWGPGLLQDLQTLFPLIDAAGLHAGKLQDYVGPTAIHIGALPPPPAGNAAE